MTQQATGKWDPSRVADYAENLARGYRQSNDTARNLGHQFYPSWNRDAEYIGHKTNTSSEFGAVALARFSPQTHEALNRMQALQMTHLSDKQEQDIRTAHEHRTLASRAASAGYHDEAAYHDQQSKLLRARAIGGTPLNHQGSGTIVSALDARDHPHPLSLLDGKIGDYAGAIHDPRGYQRIAGDTHIYQAAVGGGNHDIRYDDNGGLFGSKKIYEGLQDVHRLAYQSNIASGHIDPDVTPPNAHMGSIWFHHRSGKQEVNARAAATAKATVSTIKGYMEHPLGRQWNPEAHGLRPISL